MTTYQRLLAGCAVLAGATLLVTVLAASGHQTAAPVVAAANPAASAMVTAPAPAATPAATLNPFPRVGADPTGSTPWSLVVGDSISFGFTVDPSRYGTNSSWVAQLEPLIGAGAPVPDDLACPGETTSTYSTGCSLAALVPWLHGLPQRQVTLTAVHDHLSTLRYIVVELGANDLLAAQSDPASLPTVLAGLDTRLGAIVAELHAAAPGVPLIVANLYDPYGTTNLAATDAVDQANALIASVAAEHDAVLANFHAAINGGGQPLDSLVDRAHGDIHPTIAGHAALARAVLAALAVVGIRPEGH